MLISRFIVGIFLVGMMVLGAGVASGQQDYPNKPIRIVTAEVAGVSDFGARLVAQGLTTSFGQQAIVDNRGIAGAELVAKARPGELNYAGAGTGSPVHLASELFTAMAGVNIVWIPSTEPGNRSVS